MNSLLPAIPQIPDDPKSWLLNAGAGWHAASLTNIEQMPYHRVLALASIPGTGRSLSEASGSFGGVVLPLNVASGPDESLYLLDGTEGILKRFDPCTCLFEPVPCIGGPGSGRRQVQNPHGIDRYRGNLYVCDTGNHRVSVFALHGFVLRTSWRPSAAGLAHPWEPYALAFDSHGRAFVTDPANGCIHRFSSSGYWETAIHGLGVVTALAIDCADRLHVLQEGVDEHAQILDTDGQPLGTATRPAEISGRFPALPFQIDAQGNLFLAALCVPNASRQRTQKVAARRQEPLQGVFDIQGNPLQEVQPQPLLQYYKNGQYLSEGLDSKLYRCQWHRVILRARVPKGTSIIVSTYTSEVLQPEESIVSLPERAWETNQAVTPGNCEHWDCLVRNPGGRYLWLRLQFRSSGAATPALEAIEIEFPRISLSRYLPAVFREDASGSQFTDRFLSIFDTTLRGIETEINTQAKYFDPRSTPADINATTDVDFLSWLASWIGLTLDRHWPEEKRRRLVKYAASLYDIRGTREGLRKLLLFYLGMEPEQVCGCAEPPRQLCRPPISNCAPQEKRPCSWLPPPLILEHYQLRRWLFVGQGRLGDQAVLWGSRIVNRSQLNDNAQLSQTRLIMTQDPYRDPFHVYAHKFSVFVPASYGRSAQQKKSLENLLNMERPAHTLAQLVFVEPRFRIGFQSMIGFDSVIGRYPEGVTLNTTPLGQVSLLSESPGQQGGPAFRIGARSRLGSTTRLD